MKYRLDGRTAIITGASQGLGLEIAKKYLLAGANIVLCARDKELLKENAEELLKIAPQGQRVLHFPADVSKMSDIDNLVAFALSHFKKIDILVNNAGIQGPKGLIEEADWNEWIKVIEINLYGSVYMCRKLVPHFRANGYGKIIQLSGGGATKPMPRNSAYATSKAAVVRFAESLAEELAGEKIDINCIAPGALNTRMLTEVIEAGPEKVGKSVYLKALEQHKQGGTALSKAASLAVFLGSTASDGITGRLLAAVWDDWQSLPQHLSELSKSDIFTLRRITSEDRGKNWSAK
jgi:NAD(P)-dependent dehydrogenase (short-subunit alcohol dehydrogenase family)